MEAKRVGFLSLPAEIRNTIYNYAFHLGQNQYSMVKMSKDSARKVQKAGHSILDFLKTCKTIKSEAETIFYSINGIYLDKPGVLEFQSSLTPARLSAVESICIHDPRGDTTPFHFFKHLHLFPQLKTVFLHFDINNEEGYEQQLEDENLAIHRASLNKMTNLEKVRIITLEGQSPLCRFFEQARRMERIGDELQELFQRMVAYRNAIRDVHRK